jgi:hypothetical protein
VQTPIFCQLSRRAVLTAGAVIGTVASLSLINLSADADASPAP